MRASYAALETIVVTATKRSESMQDVPVSVQALNGQAMKNLGVATFGEYIKFLPNVVQQGSGPGRNEIYIRGAATEQTSTVVFYSGCFAKQSHVQPDVYRKCRARVQVPRVRRPLA